MVSKSFGASPLIEAIRANSLPRVIDALQDGADIEEMDVHGYAGLPLRTACFSGNVPIIRELLNQGADVNAPTADGPGAPIRAAMRAGHNEIVALLLAHGAHIPVDLDLPATVYDRTRELATRPAESVDIPLLEFDHDAMSAISAPQPAETAGNTEDKGNLIEFTNDTIEEVDLRGVYGVDTSVLTLDLERASGAWEKVEGTTKKTKD